MSRSALVPALMLVGVLTVDTMARSRYVRQAIPIRSVAVPSATTGTAHGPSRYDSCSNTGVPNGFCFPAGAGVEVLDDLHLGGVTVTGLCAFDVGYFEGNPGVTSATVTFHANNSLDDPPGPALATFQLPGLPSGGNSFHVKVPASAPTQDVWMGVAFSTAGAGLLLADPHWPGASDDWFCVSPPGRYDNFGGNPQSDFLLGVYATGTPITSGVEPEEARPMVSGFRRDPAPNPSARGFDCRFAIRDAAHVRADVLDVSGRVVARIADRRSGPGVHTLTWDGRTPGGYRASAGVHLIRLTVPGFAGSRKLVLLD